MIEASKEREAMEKTEMRQASPPQEQPGNEGVTVSAVGESEAGQISDPRDEEIKELKDRVLRLAAEMDNTRKRLEREKSDGISFANECLLRELLPVMDNLERAIEHAEKETDCQSLISGVRMTMKGFLDVLAKFGCAPFESAGKAFDPNYHEAILQREDPEKPGKTVLEEYQKGYTLHDRLLRPALVVVSGSGNQEGEG
ncbi:MAG TPA: nucleotide exchange factor GrpE [Syntrophobacteraceae bacterium]|nr:nucleotide exchange factor GrpE [Syntrophobacteraceae bacterium]